MREEKSRNEEEKLPKLDTFFQTKTRDQKNKDNDPNLIPTPVVDHFLDLAEQEMAKSPMRSDPTLILAHNRRGGTSKRR